MILFALSASPAAAQPPSAGQSKWEVEVHGGGAFGGAGHDGSGQLPPAGETFTTLVGRPSRRVSSWYFGDGVELLNGVNSVLPTTARMTAIDPALDAAAIEQSSGGLLGVRVTRVLNSRFSVDVTVDYGLARYDLNDEAVSTIEAARGGFSAAWNGLLSTGPFPNSVVTSEATIGRRGVRQVITTGALTIRLPRQGRLDPYVTAGGGVASSVGDGPGATLNGTYRFLLIGAASYEDRDAVTVRVEAPDHVFAGVLGAGFRYAVSSRWGLRVDFRDYLIPNRTETFVSATPSTTRGTPPLALASFSTPSMQFSTAPPPSTYSGPAIADFRTFEASGIQNRLNLAAGVYWRF
jgi:hypothetical protein